MFKGTRETVLATVLGYIDPAIIQRTDSNLRGTLLETVLELHRKDVSQCPK
jgi:hypothetical protein